MKNRFENRDIDDSVALKTCKMKNIFCKNGIEKNYRSDRRTHFHQNNPNFQLLVLRHFHMRINIRYVLVLYKKAGVSKNSMHSY